MKLQISTKEKIMWILESFVTKKISRAQVTYQGKKKFSDVVEYIKAGNFGKDIMSKVLRETDNFGMYTYEYDFGKGRGFRVTIYHKGEVITSMNYERDSEGAIYTVKSHLNTMDDKLPDFECDEAVVETVKVEKVDYSGKSLKELVKIFDKKLQELSKAPSSQTLTEVIDVKNAMSDKVGDMPLEDRAKFKKPLNDMGMFFDALSMQVNVGNTQFVNTYVPQIETALSELAAIVK